MTDDPEEQTFEADDGTEWVFSPGLNLWTGWVRGEEGVWTLTPEEFSKEYPTANGGPTR